MGPRQYIAGQLLATADVIRAVHERVQLCQDPQTEFALLRECLASAESTASSERTVTQFFKRDKPPKSSMRLGKGPLRDSFRHSQRTALNKPRSVPASRVLGT